MCLLAALLATGCAQPLPRVVEVQVPIALPCQAKPVDKPVFAVDRLPIGATITDQVKSLMADREQRQAYEIELEAAIAACLAPVAP
ncbi:MAG TPA: hypothetical protein VJ576_16160 [Rhodocyclaceae bacterium]|nr:hypothetical protein [Rhodocyclaceae bacterium]